MTTTQEVLNKELEEIIIARCGKIYKTTYKRFSRFIA